eukprot:1905963-Amphidinium_carterae.1
MESEFATKHLPHIFDSVNGGIRAHPNETYFLLSVMMSSLLRSKEARHSLVQRFTSKTAVPRCLAPNPRQILKLTSARMHSPEAASLTKKHTLMKKCPGFCI